MRLLDFAFLLSVTSSFSHIWFSNVTSWTWDGLVITSHFWHFLPWVILQWLSALLKISYPFLLCSTFHWLVPFSFLDRYKLLSVPCQVKQKLMFSCSSNCVILACWLLTICGLNRLWCLSLTDCVHMPEWISVHALSCISYKIRHEETAAAEKFHKLFTLPSIW